MHYLFDTSRATQRLAAFEAHRVLASPWLVGAMVLTVTITAVLAGLAVLWPSPAVWGSALICASVLAGLLLMFTFATTYFPFVTLPYGRRTTTINVAEYSDFSLLAILHQYARHPSPPNFGHATRALVADRVGQAMLRRLGLPAEKLLAALEPVLARYTWDEWAHDMWLLTRSFGQRTILPEHALAVLLVRPELKSFLRSDDLQEHDITFVAWWLTARRFASRAAARWWDPQRLLGFTGVGLGWTAGFTPRLDRLSRLPGGEIWDHITVGREEQIDQLIMTLARQRQSNVLLVGQAGTGRLGVAIEMARRVQANAAHPALLGQRVMYFHIGEVIAQGQTNAQQLAAVASVLSEMERAGNIIAVVDGLSSILGGTGGQLNLSDVLLPFFGSLHVRVVVLISSDEYHLRLKDNDELGHYFEVVQMTPLSGEQTLAILALAAAGIEAKHAIYLPYKTLRAIVEDTDGILPATPYPERAFDVLEEAMAIAQQQQLTALTPDNIHGIVARKAGIPVGQITAAEQSNLLNLEEQLHERVVNQVPAITAVARAMIRARTGVRNMQRPIATFLFLGPTGVGKTETAKTLAATYFGGEEYMIRLDMSEFQTPASVPQLIGSAAQPVGRLTAAIADRPFTVVLLDEFEKAHVSVQQLFLQVFDEGRLTDARGQVISFKHAIIIATSNAGAQYIRDVITRGALPAKFNDQLRDHILRHNIFKPELINRFDGVITFTPLSPGHIREVARRMLGQLNKRLDAQHGVTVVISDELLEFLVTVGYHPEFGARPMSRAIADTVEYTMAQKILKGESTAGQEITLSIPHLEQLLSPIPN